MSIYRMGAKAAAGKGRKPRSNHKRAGLSDQEIAAEVVRAYRTQQLLPHKAAAGGVILRAVTPDDLVQMLARFALTGTFQMPPAQVKLHTAKMMAAALALRQKPGWSYDEARDEVADLFDCSATTVYSATKPEAMDELGATIDKHNSAISALQNGTDPLK